MTERNDTMKKGFLFCVALFCITFACNAKNTLVQSFDGQLISYNVFGKGDVVLVFVHGWSCDSRYWRNQIPYFEKKYKVVAIDSSGQGNSEQTRKEYTIEAFGKDVKAVVDDVNAAKVILIGHSMGDAVIAEAATLMPDKVIGLIGVDTLHNVEVKRTKEQAEKILGGLKTDFKAGMGSFMGPAIGKNMKPSIKQWIIDDMSCQNPKIGINILEEYYAKYQNLGVANIYKQIKAPVRCVNSDLAPTKVEIDRTYMSSFEVTIMKGCGHFPMMEKPEEFNKNLEKYVKELIKVSNKK
jgi:pimeloyl-ACP methyl ester carboxylesterase